MPTGTDTPHRSFLAIDPAGDFPLQNLPYGVFIPQPGDPPRIGVAIGDWVLDLSVLAERGLLAAPLIDDVSVFHQPRLNAFMALGPAAWRATREQLTHLLSADVPVLRDDAALRDLALVLRSEVELCLPCDIPGYTDFYACAHHARNVSRLFRGPDADLPPNFRHLPIGYNGRASTVVVSGTPIRRPCGQFRPPDREAPVFGPTRELDYELEVGVLIGRGNDWGRPVSPLRAANQIFGLVLVNDWSARDIQQWEYQPLGPFLGKSFATTVSPWVVPLAALEPFRCDGPPQEPPPLEYLRTRGPQAFDLHVQAMLTPVGATAPVTLATTNLRELYWSLTQMIAHHTSNGCNLRTGDLLATGTISGSASDSLGCLLERTQRGVRPLDLPDGTQRVFLADGDTVTLTGWCQGDGYRIGFGPCTGTVVAAAV